MTKAIRMPKIPQFRQVVRDIKSSAQFVGLDDDNNPIFDGNAKLPTVPFLGTVKLHGTNASIVLTPGDEIYAQSKTQVITVEKDNAGFAQFVSANEESLRNMMLGIRDDLVNNKTMYKLPNEFYSSSYITVYGEWCGQGIQKGTVISELDKMFIIFGCKITPPEFEGQQLHSYWIQDGVQFIRPDRHANLNVHNIHDFQVFALDIDFNEPEAFTQELERLTLQVEKECPVAKMFGKSGIGEGIVWTGWYKDNIYRFKVKGEKHSNTKVKKLVTVDPEKLNSMKQFVEYACTQNRYEQAISEVVGDEELEMKHIGNLIRWVQNDIINEENDVLTESGLTHKDVASRIAQQIKTWVQEDIKNL